MCADNSERLFKLISLLDAHIRTTLKGGDDGLQYIDPIDNIEIYDHYAQSHAAAAYIILGSFNKDNVKINLGLSLLDKIIASHSSDIKSPRYHFDFNNFALCLILDHIKADQKRFFAIKNIILNTQDSNHDTVNWLPMRMYVNQVRYHLTNNEQYKINVSNLLNKIKSATYSDGFIDDRLPKGLSYNLQYNISTLAGLSFFNNKYPIDFDIKHSLTSLLCTIPIDHDINFMGRGTNQIFAWGPWIYLLRSVRNEEFLDNALSYLEENLPIALQNDNLMLNDKPGGERYLWWDYHYASVYTAHLFLWLILTLIYKGETYDIDIPNSVNLHGDSGIHVINNKDLFLTVFNGRKEYLSEKGPSLVAFGTKKNDMLIKASFAPMKGPFGLKHSFIIPAILNHCGIYKCLESIDFTSNRILRRFFHNKNYKIKIEPLFSKIDVEYIDNRILITFKGFPKKKCFFNVPIIGKFSESPFQLLVDDNICDLINVGSIKTQYRHATLFQSKLMKGSKWQLVITI